MTSVWCQYRGEAAQRQEPVECNLTELDELQNSTGAVIRGSSRRDTCTQDSAELRWHRFFFFFVLLLPESFLCLLEM